MPIVYRDLDESLVPQIEGSLSEMSARHYCLENGFTIAAMDRQRLVGILAVAWLDLPPWVPPTREAFINVIEVAADHWRQGIGRRLVDLACQRAKAEGAYQIRAWSSDDRPAAHALWRSLGFAICPATVYPYGRQVEGCHVARVL